MPRLRLEELRKTFHRADGSGFAAVDGLSIDVGPGEFLVLLGASGCGKTTLLRCVAGLEQPDSGRIALNGKPLFDSAARIDIPPERRQIGMVFQSYALWPHMTVAQNVAYPLQMRGIPKAKAREAVRRILAKVNVENLAGQHPGQISGGQQQRVALARALVCGDQLILFDEPLSNVDAKVREHLRMELLAMQIEFGFTALYVTHDQDEAMSLASHIAVITGGAIAQLGTPQDVYLRPRNPYVARFVGTVNQIEGVLRRGADGPVVDTALGPVAVDAAHIQAQGEQVILMSRPERWTLLQPHQADPGSLCLPGHVLAAAFVGSHNEYLVDVGSGTQLRVWAFGQAMRPKGEDVRCIVPRDALLVLDRG